MRKRRTLFILLAVLVAAGTAAAYFIGTPRLVDYSPSGAAGEAPADAPLRLTFSRRMNTDSITRRLRLDPIVPGEFAWQGRTLVFTPAETWPRGETVQVRLEPGGLAAGVAALPMRTGASWSFVVRYPRLAYLYPSDGPANLYAYNPHTRQNEQLTASAAGIVDYALSADGRSLVYSLKNPQGGSDIYRLDGLGPDAGQDGEAVEPVKLVACPDANCRAPRVAPGGDFLAYERTAFLGSGDPTYPQVWLLPLDPDTGSAASPAEPRRAAEPTHQTLQPTWSPAGLLTFYNSSRQAFVFLDPHSGQRTEFSNRTGQPGDWDPGGQYYVAPEISFIEINNPEQLPDLDSIANSHLIRFNRLDSSTQDLSQAEDLEDSSPAYSPDGRFLAFARKSLDINQWTPGRQLWWMRSDGSQAAPLTDDPFFNHFEFAWSPAGDQLAYVRFDQSSPTEPPELWLIEPDTKQAELVLVGGYAPQWIP